MDARKILLKAGGDKAIKMQVATAATWPKIRGRLPRVAQSLGRGAEFHRQLRNFPANSRMEKAPLRKSFWAPIQAMMASISLACTDNCRPVPMRSGAQNPESPGFAELAWCLEAYGFDRYKAQAKKFPCLVCSPHVDYEGVVRLANATYLVRDLINTPVQ